MRNSPAPEPREPVPGGAAVAEPAERRPGLTPLTLFLVLLLAYVMIQIQLVLILTLLALVLATVIERPVERLEARRVPRGVAILTVYAAIIGSLVLLGFAVAPAIGDEAATFRERIPEQLEELRTEWQASENPLLDGPGAQFLGTGIDLLEGDAEPNQEATLTALTSVGGGIVGLLALLAITFYYLMEKPLLKRLVLNELSPTARPRVTRIWDNVEAKLGGWTRGQLTLCLIIGTTATVGYGLLGIEFWPLLGLWAGITEIIPIIGPWIGGVPAVVVALTMSSEKALLVIGFIVLLQFMENTVLVPRVMRGAVGLTPLTVFVAVLAGTEFIGPAGAILAIPIAALIQVVLTDVLEVRRGAAAAQIPTWRWMRGQLGGGSIGATRGGTVVIDPAATRRAAGFGTPAAPAAAVPAARTDAGVGPADGETTPDGTAAVSAADRPATEPSTAVAEPTPSRRGWTADLLGRVTTSRRPDPASGDAAVTAAPAADPADRSGDNGGPPRP